jgi:hypothetical protein
VEQQQQRRARNEKAESTTSSSALTACVNKPVASFSLTMAAHEEPAPNIQKWTEDRQRYVSQPVRFCIV